jgi:hypothetical protein
MGLHGIAGCESYIIEEAKTHGPVAFSVVSRRSYQGEAVLHAAVKDAIDEAKESPRSELGGIVRLSCCLCVRVQGGMGSTVRGGNPSDVGCTVDPREFLVGGRTGRYGNGLFSQITSVQHVIKNLEALRAFDVGISGKVLFVQIVANDTCFRRHRANLTSVPTGTLGLDLSRSATLAAHLLVGLGYPLQEAPEPTSLFFLFGLCCILILGHHKSFRDMNRTIRRHNKLLGRSS